MRGVLNLLLGNRDGGCEKQQWHLDWICRSPLKKPS